MRKFVALFLVTVLALMVPGASLALEGTKVEKVSYQAIIDKLNKEYGTGVRFATDAEMEAAGFVGSRATKGFETMSAKDFEASLRIEIEAEIKVTAAADKAYASISPKEVVERGHLRTSQDAMSVDATTSTVTRYKSVTGAKMYLKAKVSNTPGYWVYASISEAWTTSSTFPAFVGQIFDYSLIDARRTCAMKGYGYVVNSKGIVTSNNASRYAEYWAGNGM